MTDKSDVIDLTGLLRPHYLLHPSTLLLIAADLFPLAGVAFWRWDAFLLLMLYWMDTAIIAFWTIARVAATPRENLGDVRIGSGATAITSRWAVVPFFVVHAGMFMAVHFLFLWIIFAGAWAGKIHGPGDFVRLIIVDSRLWLPLAGLMLSRGASFLFHVLSPDRLQRIEQALFRRPVRLAARAPAGSVGGEIAALYARVVIMQLAIILGAFLSMLLGTLAPFVILIVLKTAADVVVHLAVDLREQPAVAVTLAGAR
ncbi:MAG TPA: DUF6498-containing protein [Xanthobacteraceae bacterium]|nr:DUF6498-containing protein [Xanthobacteraceae bacterium]